MLGCIQPMSSPMMKRMLGFCCCCAAAGRFATIPTARSAARASHGFRKAFIVGGSLLVGSAEDWEMRGRATPHGIVLSNGDRLATPTRTNRGFMITRCVPYADELRATAGRAQLHTPLERSHRRD